MDSQVRVVNVRMPRELVDKIDHCIRTDRMYTTRPDFLIESMRSLFTWMVYIRLPEDEEDPEDMVTALRMFHIRTIYESFLEEFKSYGGDPVQIVVRVPMGLFETIDGYQDKLKPYSNFMDLLRASSIFGLHNAQDWKNRLNPDTYEIHPMFDFKKSGYNLISLFEEYDNATELYKLCKKRIKK